jgi:hypothetical protein
MYHICTGLTLPCTPTAGAAKSMDYFYNTKTTQPVITRSSYLFQM